ncbi:uncharacterized protein LOC129602232 [Paramacrobiotus metropolitanus]|uniref:uncharacterized protein LOC129602232 n=1 Tax=Paramacrobiotus metropolitanus TaxID=2943436 RepID=UPI0024458706|nr:uncharacterized protein LOC129602232 [Paramacrobiotus metropolitanus]
MGSVDDGMLFGVDHKQMQNIGQNTAMLSYWVALAYDELRVSNSSNAPLLVSFAASYSPAVDWFFLVWSGMLVLLSGAPPLLTVTVEAVIIGGLIAIGLLGIAAGLVFGILLIIYRVGMAAVDRVRYGRRSKCRRNGHWFDPEADDLRRAIGAPGQPDHICSECGEEYYCGATVDDIEVADANGSNATDSVEGSQLSIKDNTLANLPASEEETDEQQISRTGQQAALPALMEFVLVDMKAADTAIDCARKSACRPFCVCSLWASLQCAGIIILRPFLCWQTMPFTVVAFFLPERVQLPGVLLLLTVYMLWRYWEFSSVIRRNLKEKKADEAAVKRADNESEYKTKGENENLTLDPASF